MAGYRLCSLVNEHIRHAVTFECEMDDDADQVILEHHTADEGRSKFRLVGTQ